MLTIVIQAGGESRRMGQDKARLPFLGRTLIERVIERVRPVADELLVTTNQAESFAFLNLPLFADLYPGRGALGGLYTALHIAQNDLVGVVACDMPFANPQILSAGRDFLLENDVAAAIPHTDQGFQPFHAVYRRAACLPAIQAALAAERWRADAWFDQVRLHHMEPSEWALYDPQGLAFINTNTPDELRQAENLAKQIDL
jgi:molybdopterin-guanine dinucleotide biosynthesis protein A